MLTTSSDLICQPMEIFATENIFSAANNKAVLKSIIAVSSVATTFAPCISQTDRDVSLLTCPPPIEAQIKSFSKLGAALSGYDISSEAYSSLGQWLIERPQVMALVSSLSNIASEVYGSVEKTLNLVTDPDTLEKLIEVSLHTELPIGDEFEQKEARLFDKIENSGFSAGLEYVVIRQC